MIEDPGLGFWLGAVASEGALCEIGDDAARVLLPAELRAELRLPELVTVTADPEVAEEEPETILLIAGHPALEGMIERVVARGDVGRGYLAWPAAIPEPAALLERARAAIDVEHGRIDLAADPVCVYRPILRLGALVTYTLDDNFQEREEVWVDAHAGSALDAAAVARLGGLKPQATTGEARHPEQPVDLERALRAAHQVLSERIALRSGVLARQAGSALRDELARSEAYYGAALDTLARRRSGALPERQVLFDQQAEAIRSERARRRHEIEAKFEVTHALRPYRAYLLFVPALALAVTIRRGERRFPFDLGWLLPAGFVPVLCPGCGVPARLVARRDRLACTVCA